MTRLPHRIALAAALALLPACIITGANTTLTSDSDGYECEDPNSYLDGDRCFCNVGYEFCTDDPDDLSCCAADDLTTGTPTTVPGTTVDETTTTGPTTSLPPTTEGTTSTTGPTGTTGTTETTTEVTATTTEGTTTGVPECMGAQPPPDTCISGQFWCTQTEACGPEASELYRCDEGAWILEPNLAKDSCNFDGYDFAYGCVDDGSAVVFICGDGPGSDCEPADPATCPNEQTLSQCLLGKLTHFDCLVQCTEVGDANMTLYDHGFCGDDNGDNVCLCCDMGDRGCPI